MKVLFFLFCFVQVSAQSLYDPRANPKVSYTDTEHFSIQVETTLYGVQFPRGQRALDSSLKTKIEAFLKTTNKPKFKGVGKRDLEIIKRRGLYYIVENKSPERLLPL